MTAWDIRPADVQTILTGVHDGMIVYSEETFGPLVSLYRVENEAEAIEKANDSMAKKISR